jgi:hypothetical protein
MKSLLVLTVLLGTAALLSGADRADVVYLAHDKVDAAVASVFGAGFDSRCDSTPSFSLVRF